MTLRWWDREIRLRRVPTWTEMRRRVAWTRGACVVAWVGMAGLIATKLFGVW